MITKYHPMKIIHNRLHTIGTFVFDTPIQAIQYARSRGLRDNEIFVVNIEYEEEWKLEWEV
jgi:hypothetical protein